MSIKNKLALIISVLFAVLLCSVAVILIESSERQLRESIITQHIALAKALRYSFDEQVLDREKMLSAAASSLGADPDIDAERLQILLENDPALSAVFTNVLAYGRDGVVLAAWPQPSKYIGSRQLAGMDYISRTVETGKPIISKIFVSPISKQPLIVMTAPILNKDGKVVAVLGGSQYLLQTNLFSGFTDTHVGRTGDLFMLSRDRHIIANPNKSRLMEWIAPGVSHAVDVALVNGQFAGEAVTSLGVHALVTIETMKTTGWLVGAVLPLQEAYAPIDAMRMQATWLLVAMMLVLPLLVWWMARHMTQPLLLLRDRVKDMTKTPQTEALVALDRRDEIGELASAFDDLTQARHRAEKAQMRLNRALRILSSCNQILSQAHDERRLLQELCELISTHGGYSFTWIGYAQPPAFQEDSEETIYLMARAGAIVQTGRTQRLNPGDTPPMSEMTRLTLETGQAQVCQEMIGSPLFRTWQDMALAQGHHSCISLPLKSNDNTFGVLNIYAHESNAFSADEVRLLEDLSADLSFGINTLRARAAHQAAETELAFLAHHDPLTKLPNRLLLRDRFEQAAYAADRNGGRVAMLFLDLDNFKEVNDSLGHGMGDELLVRVVQRLQTVLQLADTVSREGGDEFIVLLSGLNPSSNVGQVAQTILDAMALPFEIDHYTLHTSFSIGISLYPDDGDNFDTVRKNADTALYRAKDSGRRNYRFFAEQMNEDAQTHLQMQMDLRKALQNQEFELHYQPKIDLGSGEVIGVEALIRWRRNGELVSPAEFIPAAEHSGLIIPIGEWVIGEACRQAVEWHRQGLPPMVMAVNLSVLQFKHGNIIDTVRAALEDHNLPAERLELELTESVLLQDVDSAINTLDRLKDLGVQLSIDDFGTGYSSLSYLKRLAADTLKIDRFFVRDVIEDADDAAIIKAVVQLGHMLHLKVVAEGVETRAQYEFLRACGCDQAQGFLFSRPVPAAELPEIVAGQPAWAEERSTTG